MCDVPFELLYHQAEFLRDYKTRYLALVGGYGSGKTVALALKALDLCTRNPGFNGLVFAPTMSLAKEIIVPQIDEYLEIFGFQWSFKASPLPSYEILFEGNKKSTIYVRSFENWKRVIGFNVAWVVIDELDTVGMANAEKTWHRLIARMREGYVNQIAAVSTPEGFRFMYQKWVLNSSPDTRLIRACTYNNPFLPPEFISSLYASYPPSLIKAYIEGEFINLNSHLVYTFSRDINNCLTVYQKGEPVYIGIDFNVGLTCAVIYVKRRDEYHAVDEITKCLDTPDIIRKIQFKYLFSSGKINVFPDASGGARKSINASTSDIVLLQEGGFTVLSAKSNPSVKDRILTANTAFLNALGDTRVKVNTILCPEYTNALEKLPYNEQGDPDKTSGFDHLCDAGTYPIWYLLPIRNTPQFRYTTYQHG